MSAAWLDDGDVRLFHGDALEQLEAMPSESVQCIVTSPPFWALRDYGVEGQIGLEDSPDEWCERLVDVMREARRVLRSDGVAWVEVGDTYASKARGSDEGWETSRLTNPGGSQKAQAASMRSTGERHRGKGAGLKEKDLAGAPWMLAFALRADGWYLRADVVWHRPNPMPESIQDRPTKGHSYVFLLSKSARYFYDAHAIREAADPNPTGGRQRAVLRGDDCYASSPNDWKDAGRGDGKAKRLNGGGADPTTRNARSVWTIPTEPTPFAHFATFPQALVERCVLAGTSEHGACGACGSPWSRVVEIANDPHPGSSHSHADDLGRGMRQARADGKPAGTIMREKSRQISRTTAGWEPTCVCADPPPIKPCVVLDPFMGSGTTAIVARRLGRHAVGIELNEEYLAIAGKRLGQLSLLGGAA